MTKQVPSRGSGRRWLWVAGGIVVLAAIALAVALGPKAIRRWQHRRFLEQAKAALAREDLNTGTLSLKKAILKQPADPEPYELMADLAERAGRPEAVAYRAKVVELDPDNLTNQLALAKTAFRFGDAATANRVLGQVKPEQRGGSEFQKLAGLVSVAARQPAEAEKYLTEAVRLEPTNSAAQLNLAVVRLASTNAAVSTGARKDLERLTADPSVRDEALRHLVGDALRGKQTEVAVAFSRQLVEGTNVVASDRLLHLQALQSAKSPELDTYLSVATKACGTNDVRAAVDLGRWLLGHRGPAQTLAWVQGLPRELQQAQPMPLLIVDCYGAADRPDQLLQYLQGQSWGERDFFRLCLVAKAHKERKESTAAEVAWRRALTSAGERNDRLSLLAETTGRWGWTTEHEETLTAIVRRFPNDKLAQEALARVYHAAGKTRQLRDLYARALETSPTNAALKNNVAITSLLLNPDDARGVRLAREAYDQDSRNPHFLSTYAFSLLLQQKPAEALQLFRQLDPVQLSNPPVAMYYGLVLVGAGDKADAKAYLGQAAKARMLPEETNLVASARSAL